MPKKKSDMNESATKQDLVALKGALKGEIATLRGELKDEIAVLRSEMATKKEVAELRNEIATNFDRVFKEFEKTREDRIFAVAKDREQDEKIGSLDKRVKFLEETRT